MATEGARALMDKAILVEEGLDEQQELVSNKSVLFKDYITGDLVQNSTIMLGRGAFEISMTITPTKAQYGMLASNDRSHDPAVGTRLEIYKSMRIGMATAGTNTQPGRNDGDGNGYRPDLCTPPIRLNVPATIRVVRHRNGKSQMFLNGDKVSEVDEGLGSHDLNNTNRAFRIGSRYPPEGSGVHDAFQGTITDAKVIYMRDIVHI